VHGVTKAAQAAAAVLAHRPTLRPIATFVQLSHSLAAAGGTSGSGSGGGASAQSPLFAMTPIDGGERLIALTNVAGGSMDVAAAAVAQQANSAVADTPYHVGGRLVVFPWSDMRESALEIMGSQRGNRYRSSSSDDLDDDDDDDDEHDNDHDDEHGDEECGAPVLPACAAVSAPLPAPPVSLGVMPSGDWVIGDEMGNVRVITPSAVSDAKDWMAGATRFHAQHTCRTAAVASHKLDPFALASCGRDDNLLKLWDVRMGGSRCVAWTTAPRNAGWNDVKFSPVQPNVLAAAQMDGVVQLYDRRKLDDNPIAVRGTDGGSACSLTWVTGRESSAPMLLTRDGCGATAYGGTFYEEKSAQTVAEKAAPLMRFGSEREFTATIPLAGCGSLRGSYLALACSVGVRLYARDIPHLPVSQTSAKTSWRAHEVTFVPRQVGALSDDGDLLVSDVAGCMHLISY